MKKTLLLACICAGNILYAQQRCLTVYNPSSSAQQKSIENFYETAESLAKSIEDQPAALNSSAVISGTILIPVVVHIVRNSSVPEQTLSTAQICSQIEVLNEDFNRRNADRTLTPVAFTGVSANSDIQFFLATQDPNGNAATGITYTSTTRVSFTGNDDVKRSSTGGINPWDTNRYLNIWVCNLTDGLGYAQFPWDFSSKPNTDGVVIRFDAFGRTGTLNPRYDRGRTATHEIGHWLGLRHIWADEDGCTGSDGVSDTPNQAGSYLAQCPTGVRATCGSNDMYMNYMDYTDDACMNMFSNGQKAVMRASFATGSSGFRKNFKYLLPTVLSDPGDPYSVCATNRSYTVRNIPIGSNVSWSAAPTNLVAVSSGNGATATIRAANSTSSGQVTITYSIRGAANCAAVTITKTVQIGKFTTSQIAVSGTTGVCPGNAYNYTANVPGGHRTGYTYSWTYPSGWSVFSQSTNTIRLYVPTYNAQYGAVRVSVNNGCGTTGPTGVTVFPGYSCGGFLTTGGFTIYPNPADEQLTIEQTENTPSNTQIVTVAEQLTTTNSLAKTVTPAFRVELLNSQQVVVAKGTAQNERVSLDTKSLPPGVYFLQIYRDNAVLQEQIVIK